MNMTQRCPDGGTCHHECLTRCFRVDSASPLSGPFEDGGQFDPANLGWEPRDGCWPTIEEFIDDDTNVIEVWDYTWSFGATAETNLRARLGLWARDSTIVAVKFGGFRIPELYGIGAQTEPCPVWLVWSTVGKRFISPKPVGDPPCVHIDLPPDIVDKINAGEILVESSCWENGVKIR